MRTIRLALCALLVLNPLTLLAQGPIPTPAGALLQQPIIVIPSSGVNGGGVVIAAQLKLPDGSASAPSLTFTNKLTKGVYSTSTDGVGIASAGQGILNVTNDTSSGVSINSAMPISFGSSGLVSPDTFIWRDAANTLALRNGVNAQAFNVYNTISGSDTEYLGLYYTGNVGYLVTRTAGAGTPRALNFGVSSSPGWQVTTSNNLTDLGSHSITAGSTIQGTGIIAGSATTAGAQYRSTQLSAPVCYVNCGTAPSVAGTDSDMVVTMGSSGVPASLWQVGFRGAWASKPSCTGTMALGTMAVGKIPMVIATTTGGLTVTTNGVAPSTNDVYNIHCGGTQ